MLGLSFLPWTGRIVAHNVRAKNLMNNIYCLLLILSEDAKNPRDKWLIQDCTADGRSKLESMMRIFPLYLLIYPSYCCSFLNVLYLSLSLPSFSLSPSPSHPTPPSSRHSDEYNSTGQVPNWQFKLVSPSNSCIYNTANAQTRHVVKGPRF